MSAVAISHIPIADTPAQRLRRIAAAVRVHFTWWGVHRTLTAEQKAEVGHTYSADARFLTAGKKLVDTSHDAFRKLTSLRTRIGQYWRGLTLPYTEAGIRLIRQSDIEAFVHTMEGFREDLIQGESDLNAVYDQIHSDARERLGRLYDSSDYPPEICGLFRVEWDFPSVEPPNYLMRIAPELFHQEQERVARRFEEAVQLAEQAFLAEFARLVSHLTDRLANESDGQKKVFRDTAVTNLTEFFDRFRQLNVRSNQDLDALVERAQQLVQGVSPQSLRSDTSLRQHISAEMSQVQNQLQSLIVNQPRRRIIRAPSNGDGHAATD